MRTRQSRDGVQRARPASGFVRVAAAFPDQPQGCHAAAADRPRWRARFFIPAAAPGA